MDYENQAMLVTYGILKSPDFKWDGDWPNEMKIALLKILINYFEKSQEYERCVLLQNMLVDRENDGEYNDKAIAE